MKKLFSVILASVTVGILGVSGIVPAQAAYSVYQTDNTIQLTPVIAIPSDLTGIDNPWTDARIYELLDSSNNYWSVMSEKQVGLGFTREPVRIVSTSAKSTDKAADFTATVARELGVDTRKAWSGLVIFSPAADVTIASGSKGQAASYSNDDSNGGRMLVSAKGFGKSAPQENVFAHEIGHFFRNGHANRLGCADGSVDSVPGVNGSEWANSTCKTVEYDDNNDLMSNGYALGSLNTMLAEMQGFVKPTDITTITPTTTPTDYVLKPWGNKAITNKSIKIVDADTYTPYYVELRQAVGLDSQDATDLRSGVKIVKKGISRTSVVLDPTPNTVAWNLDGAQTWQVGDVFVNAEKTFGVRVKSIVNGSAVVTVTKVTPATAASYLAANKNTTPRLVASIDQQEIPYYARSGILTVTSKDTNGKAVPGTVTVKEGTVVKATATVGTTGVVKITLSRAVSAGSHLYTISHSSPTMNTGQFVHVVGTATTTTAVVNASNGVIKASLLSPTNSLSTPQLSVKVTPETGYAPTGKVLVLKNNVTIDTLTLTSADAGALKYTLNSVPSSSDVFTVKYLGTVNSEPSESKVVFVLSTPVPTTPPVVVPTPTPTPTKPPVITPTGPSAVSVGAPKTVTATATSNTAARIMWVKPTVVGKISRYAVVISNDKGYIRTYYTTSTLVTATGLTAGTKYNVTVTAEAISLDAKNKATATSNVTVTTKGTAPVAPTPAPTKPPVVTPAPTQPPVVTPAPTTGVSRVQNVQAFTSKTSARVVWVKPAIMPGTLTKYTVTIKNSSGYVKTFTTKTTTVSFNGLTANTPYTVVITATSTDAGKVLTSPEAVLETRTLK